MIERMRFVNITGPKEDLDRILLQYITKHEINLEDTMQELGKVKGINVASEVNEYNKIFEDAQELVRLSAAKTTVEETISIDEATKIVGDIMKSLETNSKEKSELLEEKMALEEMKQQLLPFADFNLDLTQLFQFKFIKFRFGKLPAEKYKKFEEYINTNADVFFIPCGRDTHFIWGVYFVPDSLKVKIEAIFASLHFERILLSNEYDGTPTKIISKIQTKINSLDDMISSIESEESAQISSMREDIEKAYSTLKQINDCNVIKKYVAYNKSFFIITGWTTVKEAEALTKELANERDVDIVVEDEEVTQKESHTPPTKLKNFFLFKPFEMFVRMYGLPSYNEIDPTFFVAITYAILFGIMFGDVGQGAILVVGGLLFYKFKKMDLGAILALSGIFSVIFGFMYGSVFGFEEWIPTIWLKPMDNVMTILIIPCIFGVAIILMAMLFNIINAIKTKDISKLLFDKNGVAGFIFYGSVLTIAALTIFGKAKWAIGILIALIVITLILMALQEPLTRLIKKKKHLIKGSKVMFFVETFFEMFEVLLSYITNTVSFVRVGAFALSHAGMMHVVHLLADSASGNPNLVMLILGNLLVMGMEGLIVGIQVLRLEFYEIFSRFYRGNGREFKPIKKTL